MLFSTPFFLFVFLPVFIVLYRFLPLRAPVLLLGSLIFYGWSEPVFLWVVLVSACLDWLLGRLIYNEGNMPLDLLPESGAHSSLERIIALLRNRSGNDFSLYKNQHPLSAH